MKRFYVIATDRYIHGARLYEVRDRQTGKRVRDTMFESRAHADAKKFNIQDAAIPGGYNKHMR